MEAKKNIFQRIGEALTGKRDIYTAWTGAEGWWQSLVPRETPSGVEVSPEVAYQIGVVYACVNKIASTIAMLPLELVDESDNRYRFIQNDPSLRLLNVTGDNELPSFYVRQAQIAMMLLFGKGYAWIERIEGVPVGLHYSMSTDVLEKQIDGRRFYRIVDRRFEQVVYKTLPASDVIVLRYLFSQSPVVVNRDAVGLLKAAQDFAAKFFQNGGVMSGILSSDNPLTPEQIKTLIDSWEQQKGRQTRMLPFGLKFHRLSVEPDKAQSVEARKFNAQEVCRLFNVPPAMIGLEGGSSYGDYENQARHFATHCIAPVCAAIESEYNIKLVFRSNQGRWKFRHNLDELMRGDMTARANFYDKMLQAGVLNRDEVRQIERYNPIEGGTIHTVQVNQIALSMFEKYSEKISTAAETAPENENMDENESESEETTTETAENTESND
jgi:HK97 family phage portal protein